MKRKPISPLMHGIIDYVFSFALLSAPSLIMLNKKAQRLYTINAFGVILYSAFTKYPPSVKQIIPLRLHKKIDCASLALIAFETCCKEIRKDKRAITFSAVMVTAGIVAVLLTDWQHNNFNTSPA